LHQLVSTLVLARIRDDHDDVTHVIDGHVAPYGAFYVDRWVRIFDLKIHTWGYLIYYQNISDTYTSYVPALVHQHHPLRSREATLGLVQNFVE
jgi:hypothetical protein